MYKRKTSGWSQHLDFMGLDILCLELAWLGSALIRTSWQAMLRDATFWVLCVGMGFIDLLIMVLMDAYHSVIRRDSYKELRGVLNQAVYLTVGLVVFVLLQRNEGINIVEVLMPTLPIYILLCFNMRVLWKEHLRKRLHLKNHTGMLVVARKDRLKDVITALVNHNYNSYRFVGAALLENDGDLGEAEKEIAHIKHGDQEIGALNVVATRDTL
ncbi:MAG: hypothetical protein II697_06395, partial [Clostridia bacterium]|nr:hypothetical protein [Clostridia bacterium]